MIVNFSLNPMSISLPYLSFHDGGKKEFALGNLHRNPSSIIQIMSGSIN